MADENSGEGGAPSQSQIAGGFLDGQAEAVTDLGEKMLKGAPRGARFVMKKIPGAPALVFDAVDLATAPDKLRSLAGIAGGALGGAAGGALGTAAGGINAPIGAAVGSAWGQKLGQDFYDQHADEIHRGLDATKQWVRDREADLANRSPHPAGWKY